MPPIPPPTVSVPLLMVTSRAAVAVPDSVTAPVPRFRSFEPTNVKSPAQACGLFVVSVTGVPLVLSSRVPALIVNVPVPRACAVFTFSWPARSHVPPEWALEPVSVSTLGPSAARPNDDAGMSEPNVKSPAVVSMPTFELVLLVTPAIVPAKAATTSADEKKPAAVPVRKPSVAPAAIFVVPDAGMAAEPPYKSVPTFTCVPPP